MMYVAFYCSGVICTLPDVVSNRFKKGLKHTPYKDKMFSVAKTEVQISNFHFHPVI
jgi:hypothetical protein